MLQESSTLVSYFNIIKNKKTQEEMTSTRYSPNNNIKLARKLT